MHVTTPRAGYRSCHIRNECSDDFVVEHTCSVKQTKSKGPATGRSKGKWGNGAAFSPLKGRKHMDMNQVDEWSCKIGGEGSINPFAGLQNPFSFQSTRTQKSLDAFRADCNSVIKEIHPGTLLNKPDEKGAKCYGGTAPQCLRLSWEKRWGGMKRTRCFVENKCQVSQR